ncbi:MAG: hypothetical protein M1489_00565 [Firmicutes bacterium]|nr:hypothetical protein [Bacillota bacterium]
MITAAFILAGYILAALVGATEFIDKFFLIRPVVCHRLPGRATGRTFTGEIRRSVLMATVVALDDCPPFF